MSNEALTFDNATASTGGGATERKEAITKSEFKLLVLEHDSPLVTLAEELEKSVFEEFFGNCAELMEQEYGPYKKASRFLLVVDQKGDSPQAAGVIRIIQASDAGFKSLNDVEKEPWKKPIPKLIEENGILYDPSKTWDIATLAVARQYRKSTSGLHISLALEHACYAESVKNDIEYWVAIIDDKVLELGEIFGQPFNLYQGVNSSTYLDSPASTPVYARVPQIKERALAAGDWAYNSLILGKGMEGFIDFPEGYES